MVYEIIFRYDYNFTLNCVGTCFGINNLILKMKSMKFYIVFYSHLLFIRYQKRVTFGGYSAVINILCLINFSFLLFIGVCLLNGFVCIWFCKLKYQHCLNM